MIIAFVTIPRPVVLRRSYEVAAWYTDVEVPAGRYPIVEKRAVYDGRPYWSLDLPGVIVDSYTASLFGGMPLPGSTVPQGKQHRDVGRETVISKTWGTDFDRDYCLANAIAEGGLTFESAIACVEPAAEIFRKIYGEHMTTTRRDSVRCPVQLVGGLEIRTKTTRIDWQQPRTYVYTATVIAPRRLLPAGR